MALTAKDIHVIRMIIREEVQRASGTTVQATVNQNAIYAAGAVNEPVYVVGEYPFQQVKTESEYNEQLSRLTQD